MEEQVSAVAFTPDSNFLAIRNFLRCPMDGVPLVYDSAGERLVGECGCHSYPIESGIPILYAANDWPADKVDVTEIVRQFYEKTPFPDYDGLDNRDSLRAKARGGVFAKLLDEQIPHNADILEIGCGTGQMSNFLGMGWGRTVIGADLCMNSLKLAKQFRDRCAISNAHFVQINLFMAPFPDASFDIVWSNGVLQTTSDCAAAFRSIARLVKPAGFIIVGLYNWLGRLPTLWLRGFIDNVGPLAGLLDHRLRARSEEPRRKAWFMDQYKHPHETRHSIDEVLGWFDTNGYDFISCVPTIGDSEFSDDMPLFEPRSPGRYLDRLSTELEMLLTGGSDGGLYLMIGRKRT